MVHRTVSLDTRRTPVPEIREDHDIVTQITTVKTTPDNQSEVLEVMTERARFMATQPGFVSISLHRSEDGSHIVNYVQWTSCNKLEFCSPFARIPQEVAALRRTRQGGGAVPLSSRAHRGGLNIGYQPDADA